MVMEAQTAHRNQLGNAKNSYQTEAKRVLTICSAGILRSPTAAVLLNKEYGFNCRPAGIVAEYALIPVSEVLIHWADEFVFMEDWHLDKFKVDFHYFGPASSKLETGHYQVLNIPDNFDWMHPELQKHIINTYVLD